MLTMPSLGAYADLRAAKKRLLMLVTAGCVVSTAALAYAQPGTVLLAMLLIVVSNTFFVYGESLIAAFLPEIAKADSMGKVSGWGWGFGYFGGMLTLGLSLAYVLSAQKAGQTATQFVPVTMWITAAIYGAAAIVTFTLLKERALPQPGAAQGHGLAASLARLRQTWQEARAYVDFVWLMVCGFFYQAGIAVVIAALAVVGAIEPELLKSEGARASARGSAPRTYTVCGWVSMRSRIAWKRRKRYSPSTPFKT